MIKNLFLDLETTGLNYYEHGIVEIGGVIEIDGKVKEEFLLQCKPFPGQLVSKQAMAVNKIGLNEMAAFPEPRDTYVELINILDKYVNRFDSKDKFFMIGYNVYFDHMFLRNFFEQNDNKYFSSYVWWPCIDVAVLLMEALKEKRTEFENFKLESVAKMMEIEIEAHNALSDAKACREIYNKVK